VRAPVEALKELRSMLRHAVLHVDLATVGLGVLAADGVGAAEALGVTRLDLVPLIVVEKAVGGGHLVGGRGRGRGRGRWEGGPFPWSPTRIKNVIDRPRAKTTDAGDHTERGSATGTSIDTI